MSNLMTEHVTSVRHWTDSLFSFTTTRDPAFRFLNGQFAMIGLEVDGKPLMRAYSMASAQAGAGPSFHARTRPMFRASTGSSSWKSARAVTGRR